MSVADLMPKCQGREGCEMIAALKVLGSDKYLCLLCFPFFGDTQRQLTKSDLAESGQIAIEW